MGGAHFEGFTSKDNRCCLKVVQVFHFFKDKLYFILHQIMLLP